MHAGWDDATRAQLQGAPDVSKLSDAITIGSMILKEEWQLLFAGVLIVLLVCLGLCCIIALRTHRQVQTHCQAILQGIASLQHQSQEASTRPAQSDGPSGSMGDTQASLLCIDSKLLELAHEVQSLRQQNTSGPNLGELLEKAAAELKQAVDQADAVSQEAVRVASLTSNRADEVFEVVAQVPTISRTLQALGLEVGKRFAVQETNADSLLKQAVICRTVSSNKEGTACSRNKQITKPRTRNWRRSWQLQTS